MARAALLGGGRMGEALVGGLVASGWETASLAVAEISDERRAELEARFPGLRVVATPADAVRDTATVVVAVKPGDVAAALEAAAEVLDPGALVISIAAGVRIDRLEALAPGRPVVRAMPNTPAFVGKAATAIAAGSRATDAHMAIAEEVLGAVGVVVRLPEEALDAVTAVSGSGPAYLFFLAEALVDAALAEGLDRDVADQLVRQTLLGAGTLLAASDDDPAALRAAVTSPGGTTEAAVAVLEDREIRAAFAAAVAAAAARSKELGS